MTPDDPRHGTQAGYSAHKNAGTKACQACRDAAARYERGRAWDELSGRPRALPILGFRRRLEALQAIGWSIHAVAAEIGTTPGSIHRAAFYGIWITSKRFREMSDVYERLAMHPPTDRLANRRRSIAARKGYAPPLAWDDIDDPDERPNLGDRQQAATLLENYNWLTTHGESHEQACKQLGVTPNSIDRARNRARKAA